MLLHEYSVFQNEYTEENLDRKLRQLIQRKYGSMGLSVINTLDRALNMYRGRYKDGIPFVLHPLRVTWMLLELDQYATSKMCIAALLHSAPHERLLTLAEIEREFGGYVSKLVQSIGDAFCCSAFSLEDHETRQRRWQKIMGESHEVRSLRTFDDLDTLLSWKFLSESSPIHSSLRLWLADVREMSLPLAHATNIGAYTIMRQEYEKLSNKDI